jgi:hypothetical protein
MNMGSELLLPSGLVGQTQRNSSQKRPTEKRL